MPEPKLIGQRFEMMELIGEGGMGKVYRGRDTQTDQFVAIKALRSSILEDDPSLSERFMREGEALRKLNHPSIVKMLTAFQDGDQHYLVMEYVGGGSLHDMINAQGGLPIERVLEIALDLADALTRAHRLKIIHRDIKPHNVLLAEDGTARLTDFGVARWGERTRMTESGSLIGTYSYLSPEGCEGAPADERTDIWAFGVMLFEMLTGTKPFVGNSPPSIMFAIIGEPIPNLAELRPETPLDLILLITHMLEKDRDARISSVRQIGAELETTLSKWRAGDTSSGAEMHSRFATPTPFSKISARSTVFLPDRQTGKKDVSDQSPTSPSKVPTVTITVPELQIQFRAMGTLLLVLFLVIIGVGALLILRSGNGEDTESNTPTVAAAVATTPPTQARPEQQGGAQQGQLPQQGQGQPPLQGQGQPPPQGQGQPVQPVASGELMVLVADLEPIEVTPTDYMRFIRDDLTEKLERGVPFSQIRIRHYIGVIATVEDARAVADENNATVVVWGSISPEAMELNLQVGVLDAFPLIPFDPQTIINSANVRLRVTDDRTQSIAPNVLGLISLLQSANGDGYESARTWAIEASLKTTDSPEILGETAAAYLQVFATTLLTDADSSLTAVNNTIEMERGNPFAYIARSLLYVRAGQYEDAKRDAETAQKLAPEAWTSPLYILANIAVIEGDLESAKQYYDAIIEARPADWFPYNFRGAMSYLQGDYEAAKIDLDRALSLEPNADFPYTTSVGIALREGRIRDAFQLSTTVITRFPSTDLGDRIMSVFGAGHIIWAPLFSAYGNLYLGQYEQALKDVEDGLAINDQFADLYFVQGMANCSLEDYQAAEESFTQLLSFEPDYALIYLLRADARKHENDIEGADSDLAKADSYNLGDQFSRVVEKGRAGNIVCGDLSSLQ